MCVVCECVCLCVHTLHSISLSLSLLLYQCAQHPPSMVVPSIVVPPASSTNPKRQTRRQLAAAQGSRDSDIFAGPESHATAVLRNTAPPLDITSSETRNACCMLYSRLYCCYTRYLVQQYRKSILLLLYAEPAVRGCTINNTGRRAVM